MEGTTRADTIRPATVSIVTPAFNESDNLEALYRRLSAVMDADRQQWDWIVIDDHSSDRTFAIACALAAHDNRVLGLRLARNVGSHAAILCGFAHARGDVCIVIAADGEDPPEEIPRLLAAWRQGAAVVWGERRNHHGRLPHERLASKTFHRLMRRWSGLENLTVAGSDFFLVSRPAIDAINTLGERNANVMALLAWVGFQQVSLFYDKAPRLGGRSGWTLGKKIGLLLDSIFGFSLRPIRTMSVLGFATATLGFCYALIIIFNAMIGNPVEGWSSLMVVVLILGGVQMIMLGILGEYLWRSLDEGRSRPRYIVEKRTDQSADLH